MKNGAKNSLRDREFTKKSLTSAHSFPSSIFHNFCANLSVTEDGNNNVKPRKLLERVNSRSTVDIEENAKALPAPKIGAVGEYFNVHVTMAANPANFTVQPLDSKEDLRVRMLYLRIKFSSKSKNKILEGF